MAACMTVGLMTAGASAFQYSSDADDMGKMIQPVIDWEQGGYGYCPVQLVLTGSVINFSEPGEISIYVDGEYGTFTTKPVQSNCTSFTIPDTKYTYVFTSADGGMAMFRGVSSRQAPITRVGDLSGDSGTTIILSKPVVDITVETLAGTDWDGNPFEISYLVYEVPVGTTVSDSEGLFMLSHAWDTQGNMVSYDQMSSFCAKQFPGVAFDEDFGTVRFPLTLNQAGYYYSFAPEAMASSFPVFKVVDEQPESFTPRANNFTDMNWSKPYVDKVYGYGWMEGIGENQFGPEGNLTIAQAITLAARIHANTTNSPINYSEGEWYQSYVDYCERNYLLGYYDTDNLAAHLNEKATRMDMVRILASVANVPGLGWYEEETVNVPDVDKDNSDYGYLVYDWYRAGIVSGDAGTHNFRPNDSITRGEVAVILCNLLGL